MITLAISLALALAPLSRAVPADDEPDGGKLVQVSVAADKKTVAPGSTFTLAVTYEIAPKWHVYWENPGDSGLATKAQVKAPPGFVVGEARYPLPRREVAEGDITMYVHERELVLLVDVAVPADAKPGTHAKLDVHGSWLVCTDVCFPGAGDASIELDVCAKDEIATSNSAKIDAARKALPRPWKDLEKARIAWSGDEAAPHVLFAVPRATKLDFFPLTDPATRFKKGAAREGKSGASYEVELAFERKSPSDTPRIRGVLVVEDTQGKNSYLVDDRRPTDK